MGARSRTRTVLMIAFLVTVWGVNWPLSKIALTSAPPILFSGIRTLIGGILLLVVALPRYKRLQFRETWTIYLVSALLNVVLYYGLQTVGLTYMPAGLFAAIVFLQPVLVGLFSWMWLGELMYGLKITGLLLGFLGVGIISSGGLSAHVSVIGVLFALGSALTWALGTVYVKKTSPRVDPVWLLTLQLLIGGVVMTAAGTEVESWSAIDWNPVFIICLLFISLFVIALGWLVFNNLILKGEASKMASFTFLIPLVAILIGALFLHEPFTLSLAAGMLLIILSIYIVNRKPGRHVLKGEINLGDSR